MTSTLSGSIRTTGTGTATDLTRTCIRLDLPATCPPGTPERAATRSASTSRPETRPGKADPTSPFNSARAAPGTNQAAVRLRAADGVRSRQLELPDEVVRETAQVKIAV